MKFETFVLGYKDLKLTQDNQNFVFTIDSILLARFIDIKSRTKKICDFGTNNAIIPLVISQYTKAKIVGVDINANAIEIAKESIANNGLEEQIIVVNEDIKEFAKKNNNEFDIVYSNPPYFKVEEGSKFKKISQEVINARHETMITLEEIITSAAICLRHRGKLIMVHIASRMDEIFYLLRKHHFTIKKLRIIYSKKGGEAKKILIEAENRGNEGMTILEPLYVHNDDQSFTEEVNKMLEN
ncbi:methyltransferase [Spiroplasma sp. TIUS-1]|uniref:tRNA1(Val) (adenine(37)-N6)-methyltransferase n=1 Tax=Spiroplasma sp. TIUS-1 TaxID=216963 RepID=UPI0013985B64|nr:methyltransferase [Spiroplasma sp. TIUS-1]QHX35566.1 methyltransferase [Spiroplasma sp. TIUS-1]